MVSTHIKQKPLLATDYVKLESQKNPQPPGGHCSLYVGRYHMYLKAKTQTLSQTNTSLGKAHI